VTLPPPPPAGSSGDDNDDYAGLHRVDPRAGSVEPPVDSPLLKPRPRGLSGRRLRFDHFTPRRGVQWLAPGQLARTGLRVALAEGVGAYLDKREQQVYFSDDAYDESVDRDELWLDYAADTGDGFHGTYAVAYSLGRPQVRVVVDKRELTLPRGKLLVLGGDEVYPTPSAKEYDDRMRGPFEAAWPTVAPGEERPTIYALPGNHDWYDGLTAFFRVFAGMRTTIGAWQTAQKRSYFAIKLPHNWWLFGLDAQEATHIDDPQLEYFHKVIDQRMSDGDRIILCTPNPSWVQGKGNPDVYRAMDYFLRRVVEPAGQESWLREKPEHERGTPKRLEVPLMLSGDWHHYSRYERDHSRGPSKKKSRQVLAASMRGTGPVSKEDRAHLVTCGGGGAYLMGTQYLPRTFTTPPPVMRPPKSRVEVHYRRVTRYPSLLRSFWLGLGAPLRLPTRNPSFVVMLGILQAMLWYTMEQAQGTLTVGLVLAIVVLLGLTGFLASGLGAHRSNGLVRGGLTLAHAVAQFFGVRAVMTPIVDRVWQPSLPKPTHPIAWDLSRLWEYGHYYLAWLGWYAGYALVAGVVSAVVVGIYLIVASLMRVNINELYSSQRLEGHKAFLRMHIAPTGDLTVYAIAIPRVRLPLPGIRGLHWKANPDGEPTSPWFLPRRELAYRLIDSFTIPAR